MKYKSAKYCEYLHNLEITTDCVDSNGLEIVVEVLNISFMDAQKITQQFDPTLEIDIVPLYSLSHFGLDK